MELSPSWEAKSFSASQIPHILCNPKDHCRIRKSPSLVPILSQINPVHGPHPTSWTSVLILSFHLVWVLQVFSFHRISPPKPRMHLSSSHTCYVSRLSHSSWFYHPHNIWWAIQPINQGFKLYFCVWYFWEHKKRYENSETIFYLILSYFKSFNVYLPFLSTCRFIVPYLIKM